MTIALENSNFDCDNNIVGTLNILQTARELNIPCSICSTIHVYGNGINEEIKEKSDRFYRDPVAINESHPILTGQITPLHVSKYATELYARAFTESYGSPISIFRLTGILRKGFRGKTTHGYAISASEISLAYQSIFLGLTNRSEICCMSKMLHQAFYDWYQHAQLSGVYNICGGIETSFH